jgi:hypothetical protein
MNKKKLGQKADYQIDFAEGSAWKKSKKGGEASRMENAVNLQAL